MGICSCPITAGPQAERLKRSHGKLICHPPPVQPEDSWKTLGGPPFPQPPCLLGSLCSFSSLLIPFSSTNADRGRERAHFLKVRRTICSNTSPSILHLNAEWRILLETVSSLRIGPLTYSSLYSSANDRARHTRSAQQWLLKLDHSFGLWGIS